MRFPILIDLRRSVRFTLLIIVVHSAALVSTCVLPWSWQLRLSLVLLIACATWRAFRAPVVVGMRILASDRLDVVLVNGAYVPLSVRAQSTVYQHLILLRGHLGNDGKAMSIALFPDQMLEGQFRQLRLWLRAQIETKSGVKDGVF